VVVAARVAAVKAAVRASAVRTARI